MLIDYCRLITLSLMIWLESCLNKNAGSLLCFEDTHYPTAAEEIMFFAFNWEILAPL